MSEATARAPGPPGWLRRLKQGADTVGVLFFCAAFLGFVVQIFFRYVLNDPLRWTEEATLIAFIWTVFWAAAFMVNIRDHVTFDVLYDAVSPQVRRVMAILSMIVLAGAFALLIPATWDYLEFLQRRRSPVMRIPMFWIYGCYFLFVVNLTIQGLWRLWRLSGPGWRDEI